ncbi:MAG: GNAT family N-acetyltransferase [Devosia sp.]
MTITLKRMQPGDELDFTDIAADVFDEPINSGRLEAYLMEPGHLMILAFDAGTVVGQCAAVIHRHPDKVSELYIDEVGTATSHLRQGIATRMMEAMFNWGRELGCREAWLGTDLDNLEANGLYRKMGGKGESISYYEFEL